MYKEISEKIKTLEEKKKAVKNWHQIVADVDRIDWIYSCMRAGGFPLDRSAIEDILNGKMHVELTLDDYTKIEQYKELFRYVDDTIGMSSRIDQKILAHLNGMIVGRQTLIRKTLPPLRQYSFLPPQPQDVIKELRTLFRDLYDDSKRNTIEKAAWLHNEIIRIYPFDEECEATARAALFYYLKQEGFYPVSLGLSDDEYTQIIKDYVNKKDEDAFTRVLERAVYNKVDMLVSLLACEEEM